MLGAGRYREKITIQRRTRVDLPGGGFDFTWTDLLVTYADVEGKRASVDTIATHEDINEIFEIKLRYRIDITITLSDRMVWRGRIFKLVGFPPSKNRDEMLITAVAENESTDNGTGYTQDSGT